MRHNQSEPADGAAQADGGGGQQGGADDHQHALFAGVRTGEAGFALAQRQHVDAPAHQQQHGGGQQHQRGEPDELFGLRPRQAAHLPIDDFGQLGFGIGQVFDQAECGRHKAGYDNACQHKHHRRIAPDQARQGKGEGDGRKPAGKGRALHHQDATARQHRRRRADTRAGRYAQEVGRHQRVAEYALVHRTGQRQGRAHQHGGGNARQAQVEDDVGVGFVGVLSGKGLPDGVQRDGVASPGKGKGGGGQEGGQREGEQEGIGDAACGHGVWTDKRRQPETAVSGCFFVGFRAVFVVFQAAFTGLAAPKLCFQTASSGFCRVCAAGTHAVAGVRAGAGGAVRAWYPRAWQSHTPYAAWLGSLKGFSDGLFGFNFVEAALSDCFAPYPAIPPAGGLGWGRLRLGQSLRRKPALRYGIRRFPPARE